MTVVKRENVSAIASIFDVNGGAEDLGNFKTKGRTEFCITAVVNYLCGYGERSNSFFYFCGHIVIK